MDEMAAKPLDPRLFRVEPVGTVSANAFWDGHDEQGNHVGGFGPVERHQYPHSPRGDNLREMRVASRVTLREAADALGLRAEELSGLEHGRYCFADASAWESAMVTIIERKKGRL
jgi:hypothetical protein